MKIYFPISILLLCIASASAQSPQFINPVDAVYMEDYYLVNYVDWKWEDFGDYQCHEKTYDGHQGTDFVIRNFNQMDSGVNVLAADDGVVTFVLDTLFDRNKTAVSGGFGNYICIKHDNLMYTYYAHLKKNSATVSVGDTIVAGEIIGQIGSSGFTSDPHLHFEVWYDSLYNIDPFEGPCGNPTTLWIDPLPYVYTFGIIDYGTSNFIPTLDTLKERLPTVPVFSSDDEVINFWMQGYGVTAGDVSTVQWFTPSGELWYQFDYNHLTEFWYYYFWSYIDIPPDSLAGIFSVVYLLNGEEKITTTFELTAPVANTYDFNNSISVSSFKNAITLQFTSALEEDNGITVLQTDGRILYSDKLSAGTTNYVIETSHWSKGIYILHITGKQNFKKMLWVN